VNESPVWADSDTATKLRQLHDVTRQMMQADCHEELFTRVTAAADELLGFKYNTVRRHDQNPDRLVPVAVSPALCDQSNRRVYERDTSVQWNAIETGRMLVFQSVADIEDGVRRPGDGSMMVVPLTGYGVLTLGSPEPRSIDERDRQLARVFGANIETAAERVEQLRALERRERRLEAKTERLERFASKLGHELRNPLNVIAGKVDLARQTGDPSHFDDLEQSVTRMTKLVDDLLAFAREGEIQVDPEWLDLGGLSTDCWHAVPTEEAALRVESTATIRGDADRVRQVLQNLFRNAVEHAGKGVTVTVGTLPEGFYVEDDGKGIPPSKRDRILETGETAKAHWTGIGLRVVSEIAEAHDWTVQVGESDDGGARFEFRGVECGPGQHRSAPAPSASGQ
jgi:signal transduction histidine kinase